MDLYQQAESIIATIPTSDLPDKQTLYYGMTRESLALQVIAISERIDNPRMHPRSAFTTAELIVHRNSAAAYYILAKRLGEAKQ